MEKESFKYYAFISYSHKDKTIAKKLQKRLQSYHLPSKLQKNYPELPENLNPIFMDESNLVAVGTLKESLENNLHKSKFLILICSPSSAQSVYVNNEVDYFIKLGRLKYIIPLIVEGIPHTEKSSLECFPPALLALHQEDEILGIGVAKFGKRNAFLRVIATMLELDLDNFVSREARERKRKTIIFTAIVSIIMIVTGMLIWHNTFSLEEIEKWYKSGEQSLENKDYQQAFRLFNMAAEKNYAPAQDKLGWMYQNGWGVEKDYLKAKEFYLKAVNQGNHLAQASIGFLYYKGLGVEEDLEEALKWYKKAAAQGHQTAKTRIEEITREIDKGNKQKKSSQRSYQVEFPVSATITAKKVKVFSSPNINSTGVKQINIGDHVSISKLSSENNADWYLIKTINGLEGWVKSNYVTLNNVKRTQLEIKNKRKSLPASGYVKDTGDGFLNIRNIPSLKSSKVVSKIDEGENITILEIFAGERRDWYYVKTKDGVEGWASGKYIELQ